MISRRSESVNAVVRARALLDAAMDVILDPVFVPPLDRIHLDTVDLHREMQMIAASQSCGTGLSHALTTFHQVTFLDGELAQVPVNRLKTIAVIDDDAVSINSQRRGPHHFSVVGGDDW